MLSRTERHQIEELALVIKAAQIDFKSITKKEPDTGDKQAVIDLLAWTETALNKIANE